MRSTLTHPRSEASVLIDLTTKSAKKFVVQLPATVVWVSAHMLFLMSHTTFTSHVGAERVEPWLVWLAKELECMVLTATPS